MVKQAGIDREDQPGLQGRNRPQQPTADGPAPSCWLCPVGLQLGLNRKIEDYKATGKSPGAMALHRELNALKQSEIPWMYDVSKAAPQEALRDLDKAYTHFFRRCKQGDRRKGFPRFKSRKHGVGTFRLTGTVRVSSSGRHVQLPRLGRSESNTGSGATSPAQTTPS